MLIQFTVANFRSIKEPQTLSMVAAPSLRRLRDLNTFTPTVEGPRVPNLLRCAAIFGPNAAGKTNLIKSMLFVEEMVLFSSDARPNVDIRVKPFLLDESSSNEPSTFEIDFIEGGVRYQFGFSATPKRIVSEWLISYTTARGSEIYRRDYDSEADQDKYTFGRSFEGGKLRRVWADQTGPTTLYLSRAVQASSNEFQQLQKPYQWFSNRLRIDSANRAGDTNGYTHAICESAEGKKKVIEFLNTFDIPIVDIEIKKRKIDLNHESSPFNSEFLSRIKFDDEDLTRRDPIFTHLTASGKGVEFRAQDESEGTMNLFHFAAKWIDVLEKNYVLFVDELDSSLHPLAVWELIRRLNESGSQAQLIFTTHDIAVLKSKLLRRDQTFFVSPNAARESELYSLLDFKGREEDAFEDRYLQGRYGATPLITR